MLSKLKKITKGGSNRLNYLRCQLCRPAANALFARVSRKVKGGGSGSILCEALWDHPYHWLRVAMLRNALVEEYGSGVVGLYLDEVRAETLASLRSLPLSAEEAVPKKVAGSYLRRAEKIISGFRSVRDIIEAKIYNGYPGHYFYDGVLKIEALGTIDVTHPRLIYHLGFTLQLLEAYQRIFERHDIRAVIVSHPTHFRFSTLVWTAIKRGIPVYKLNYRNEYITLCKLESEQDFMMPYDNPQPQDRDRLSCQMRSRLIRIGQDYLDLLRQGKTGEYAAFNIYKGQRESYRRREQICAAISADPNKPNIVIFGNCWPDFPNSQGPCYFTDYQQWFELTQKAICSLKQYNWVLRPHPAESSYGIRATLKKMLRKPLPDNVYLWPQGASGNAVEPFADCVVSARGSTGVEYPAIGKRTLVAAPAKYTDWGFVNFTNSAEEYCQALAKAYSLPEPDQKQREDALIYVAFTYCSPPETQAGGYKYPLGALSYLLWPKVADFIEQNKESIDREINMIKHWLRSGLKNYNVFKHINYGLW